MAVVFQATFLELRCPALRGARTTSLRGQLFNAVDNDDIDRPFGRFELQTELFLQRSKQGRSIGIGCRLEPSSLTPSCSFRAVKTETPASRMRCSSHEIVLALAGCGFEFSSHQAFGISRLVRLQ